MNNFYLGLPEKDNFIKSDDKILDYDETIIFKWNLKENCNKTGLKGNLDASVYKKILEIINKVSYNKQSFQDLLDNQKIEKLKGDEKSFNVSIPKDYKDLKYYSFRISNGKKFCRLIGIREDNYFNIFMLERSAGDIYNH